MSFNKLKLSILQYHADDQVQNFVVILFLTPPTKTIKKFHECDLCEISFLYVIPFSAYHQSLSMWAIVRQIE